MYSNPNISGPKKSFYSVLEQKPQWKTQLQDDCHWPHEPRVPVLCFPAGMSDELGGRLLQEMLPGILAMQCEILILGKGSADYGALFTKLAKEHSHRVHIVPQTERAVEQMYGAADMAIFLAETPAKEIAHCLASGIVPVAVSVPGLEDYKPVQETGNSFLIESGTKWHAFAALVRALETYKFPFDWRTIQKHCVETAQAGR